MLARRRRKRKEGLAVFQQGTEDVAESAQKRTDTLFPTGVNDRSAFGKRLSVPFLLLCEQPAAQLFLITNVVIDDGYDRPPDQMFRLLKRLDYELVAVAIISGLVGFITEQPSNDSRP
jgi:hypothetical protein